MIRKLVKTVKDFFAPVENNEFAFTPVTLPVIATQPVKVTKAKKTATTKEIKATIKPVAKKTATKVATKTPAKTKAVKPVAKKTAKKV